MKLHFDGVANFTELELHSRVLAIAIAVVFGEDVEGLVKLVVGDQESGRLGNPFFSSGVRSETRSQGFQDLHQMKMS